MFVADDMPSGDPNEHQYWCNKHPSGFGDIAAIKYLTKAGYKNSIRPFFWKKPTPEHVPTDEEQRALMYLIHEWDFGGLENE